VSPHCPPLGALPPQADTHTRPPSLSPRTPATGWGAGQRGWGQLLFQVGSDPFPGSGMAAQPTAASLRLSWSCSPCKRPHRLQRCFTPAEDLAHGICKRDGCSCLKRAHPGRGKHTSTEACSLRTGRPFSWACTPAHARQPEPPVHCTHPRRFLLPADACATARKTNRHTHKQTESPQNTRKPVIHSLHTQTQRVINQHPVTEPPMCSPQTHIKRTHTL